MKPSDCFAKLNLDFSDTDLDKVNMTFGHSYKKDGRDIVLIHHPEVKFVDHIKSKFPESFQPCIRSVRITHIHGPIVPAHRDHGGFVCINYYLVTEGGRTIFYSEKPNAKPFVGENQKTANGYRFEDVNEEFSFVADTNSCYLLNIGEIHTIDIPEGAVRKMIQVTIEPEFDDYHLMLNKCKELNLVESIN